MRFAPTSLSAVLLGITVVLAQSSDQPTCSLEKKCPESAPCCSLYGHCGVGAYCLGGCDPRMSFSLDSCMPAPVCEDRKMRLDSTDRIADVSKYLGDASKSDWVVQGEAVTAGGNVLLTMPRGSVGTVLASTVYMWYGSVKARMKTSRGRGVVTAFILFSDVKDEIDYEWVGVDLKTSQTNYYFQGIPLYDQSKNISLSDTFHNWHEYEIKWTPDEITWLVNGQVGRVKKRSETWNETAQQWDYPQTPSRVKLSIWPGGLESNAKGTIDWAGGLMDWDHEDIEKAGYFYTAISDVEIKCWDTDKAPGTNKGRSYVYDNWLATNDTVIDGNARTTLRSLEGTGLDKDKGGSTSKSNGNSSPSSTGSRGPNLIPGGGSHPGGVAPGEDEDGDGSGSSGSNQGSGGGGGGGNGECNAMDFNQDESACGSGGNAAGSEDSPSKGSGTAGASGFAALVAVAGLFLI